MLPGLIIGRDFQFWGERTHEGRRWLEALLAYPLPISHSAADAWYGTTYLAIFNQDYAAARAGFETHYQMIGDLGEPTHLKIWNLGFIALGEGDIPGAGDLFELFLVDERTTLNRDGMVAWGHYGLGSYDLMAGSPAEAQAHFEASLALFRAAH